MIAALSYPFFILFSGIIVLHMFRVGFSLIHVIDDDAYHFLFLYSS